MSKRFCTLIYDKQNNWARNHELDWYSIRFDYVNEATSTILHHLKKTVEVTPSNGMSPG